MTAASAGAASPQRPLASPRPLAQPRSALASPPWPVAWPQSAPAFPRRPLARPRRPVASPGSAGAPRRPVVSPRRLVRPRSALRLLRGRWRLLGGRCGLGHRWRLLRGRCGLNRADDQVGHEVVGREVAAAPGEASLRCVPSGSSMISDVACTSHAGVPVTTSPEVVVMLRLVIFHRARRRRSAPTRRAWTRSRWRARAALVVLGLDRDVAPSCRREPISAPSTIELCGQRSDR